MPFEVPAGSKIFVRATLTKGRVKVVLNGQTLVSAPSTGFVSSEAIPSPSRIDATGIAEHGELEARVEILAGPSEGAAQIRAVWGLDPDNPGDSLVFTLRSSVDGSVTGGRE